MMKSSNKTGFLKDKDGKDIITLPDEDGTRITFNKRVANCRCYVSENNDRGLLASPWGNLIIKILEKEEKA